MFPAFIRYLIPLLRNAKIPPRGVRWKEAHSCDPDVHAHWIRQGNVGCPMDPNNLVVADFDDLSEAAAFRAQFPDLATVVARTRRGEHHYYSGRTPTRTSKTADIRGIGAYVVCAPSVVSGFRYHFVRLGPLQPFPEELFPRRAARAAVPLVDESDPLRRISRAWAYAKTIEPAVSGHGGHNKTMYFAGALIQKCGLTVEQAWPIALSWNAHCVPPWSERDLLRKLHEAERLKDVRAT